MFCTHTHTLTFPLSSPSLSHQVLNMTEIEVGQVEVRVGLLGSLRFMDAAPQAVRNLRGLLPQVHSHLDIGTLRQQRGMQWRGWGLRIVT